MAKKYDIYFSSSTQLNAKSSGGEQEKNAGMIRGSFALIDKADMGVIIMPPSVSELEKVADILKSFTGFNNRKPNRVEHIFKSRGTKFKEVRIWQYVDLGTVEITDMFVTGYDYKRININPTLPKPIV
jgi:replicative DNA helicase